MEVSLIWDRDTEEQQFIVCANEADWREVLRKSWGIEKS